MMQAISEAQLAQLGTINSWMSSVFALNSSDPIYNAFRDKTTLGLEVASLVTGGYAAAKGVVAFHKLVKAPVRVSGIARNEGMVTKHILTREKIKNYLSIAESLSKKQIISDLESIGLRLKGKSPGPSDKKYLTLSHK